ncbi:MAG: tRNA (adenosine(37)-N6)-threonylcarbamoyltransferase complex transferase subunit TsaD [Patescibacteria group bacterium]|mgnify:CR=1 FL=1
MIILGIETSCDETAVSIVEAEGGLEDLNFKLLGSVIHSQIEIHKQYGGVFPALAKREHIKNLPIVLEETLKKANFELNKIDLIAVTVGPGLEPSLWTGINFSEELGKKWHIPVIGTNHMEGHIASVLFKAEENPKKNLEFPALALLISGGHTELVFLKSWAEKEKIGETQDDAVGEAFDKVARMLGLPYPGGPEISKLAEEARIKNIKLETKFPRPMIHSKDFNFSFSGLKTAVLYYLRDKKEINKLAVAREFEDAVIETLISKTKKAIERVSKGTFWDRNSLKVPFDTLKTLIIGGGVIANKALRENFLNLKEDYPGVEILIPEKSLTTDNATMIAAAGYIEYLTNKKPGVELKAQGNLNIS